MSAAAVDRPLIDRRDHDGQAGWDARREDPHESTATNQLSWDNEVVPTLRKRLEAESQYLTSRLSNEFPTTGSSSAYPSSSHGISKIPLPAHRAKRKGSLTPPASHMLLTDEREPMPPPMAVTTNSGRARVHSTPFAFHQPFSNKAAFHPPPALPSDQQPQQQQLKDTSSTATFPSKGVGRNYASQNSRIPAPRLTASSAGGSPSRGYLYPLTTAASRAGSSSSSHSSSDHSHMSNHSSTALPPPKTMPTDPYYPGSLTADEEEAVRSDRMIRDEVAPFKILSPDLQPGRIDQFTEQELLKQSPAEATSVIRRREMLKIARHGHEPTENETGEGSGVLGARSQQHEQQMSAPSELRRTDLPASPTLRVRAASLSKKKPHTATAVVTPPAAAVTVASNTSTPTRAAGSVNSQSGASPSPANALTSSSGVRTLQNKAHSTSTLSARSRKNLPGPSASMVKSRSDNTGFGGPPSLYPNLQEFGSIRESMLNENEIPPESMEPPTSAELRNWDEVVLPTVRKNQKSNFLLDDWTEEDHAVSPARSAKARRLERQKQQYAAFDEGDVLATAPAREGVTGQTQEPTTYPTVTKNEPIELIRLAPPAVASDDQRPRTVDIKPPGSPAPFSNSWDRSRETFTPSLRPTPASSAAFQSSPSDQENGKATQMKPPKEKSRGCCIVM